MAGRVEGIARLCTREKTYLELDIFFLLSFLSIPFMVLASYLFLNVLVFRKIDVLLERSWWCLM